MPKILIVEDDQFKMDNLIALVTTVLPTVQLAQASDVSTAISAVNRERFDLLIVDMALPSHPVIPGGGSPMSLLTGGLEILLELSALERNDDCIVVTQYPEIEIAGRFFPVNRATLAIEEHIGYSGVTCLEYSEESAEWKNEFLEMLKKYENTSS
ncbi:response regulator [Caballeronia sp. 15715]|uniref:response regulator n=1 Tax=Caballeronia sp. 15715 TaxID=3391030 RepID=UPI0039E2C814